MPDGCVPDRPCSNIAHMVNEADVRALGERVAAAREQAGLTQLELANAVSLERSVIAKLERGLRKLTAFELSTIAQVLGRRMDWFLTEPAPAIVSHRSHEGLATVDSQIDRLLEDIARDVEFVDSLDDHLVISEIPEASRPESSTQAEDLAAQARTLLGITAGEPIGDLVGAVASVGLFCFSQDLGPDTADAGTVLLRRGSVTLVNSQNKVGRRRLALAHEFGHYLLADEYTVDWRVGPGENVGLEALLDRFARALLLPTDAVWALWAELTQSSSVRVAAVRTASRFRVDMATLARRLAELKLVAGDEADQIRASRTTQADIIEHNLYVPADLEGTTVPPLFAQAVLRLFRREQISSDRALGLLRGTFEDDDLPELPVGSEGEIWKYVS